MTDFNTQKPVIITKPGDYITRNGKRVTIREVYNGSEPYTFPCKGAVWRLFRGKVRPKGYCVWMRSGFFNAVGESNLDIVGEWVEL